MCPGGLVMSITTKALCCVALASAFAFAGPVSHFGKLVTCSGGHLCGEKTGNTPVQVKGPSLYWSTGLGTAFYTEPAVNWFVRNMDIGIIRAAMAIKYWDTESRSPISMSDGNNSGYTANYGYLSSGTTNKANQKLMIETVIQAAIDNDIYVIVDWHSHVAHTETQEAVSFFREMATKYKDVPNIIWEIYNEPVTDAGTINTYANSVAGAIRGTGNQNLIVVGSTKYSSYPKAQSQVQPGLSYTNIAYTFHFYAASHSLGNGNDAGDAVSSGVPVFVTEWGTTNYDGDGTPDEGKTRTWTQWMDENKISNCNWFAGADAQQSAMFSSGTTMDNLDVSRLTTSGKLFQSYMQNNGWTTFVSSSDPNGANVAFTITEGESKTLSTELKLKGEVTSVAKPAAGEVTFTGNSITYKAASSGSPKTIAFNYEVTYSSKKVQGRIFVDINQKPALKDTSFSVSFKKETKFSKVNLGAMDPVTGMPSKLSFVSASATSGHVEIVEDTLVYTPSGEGTDVITYTMKNSNGNSTAKITLTCENQAPEVYEKGSMGAWANTDPVYIPLKRFRANDADGDSIWFKKFTKGDFPGTLELNATKDTLIYTPEANKIGTVSVLAVVTDGKLDSEVGKVTIKITGAGISFDGTISEPTLEGGNPKPASSNSNSNNSSSSTNQGNWNNPQGGDVVPGTDAAIIASNMQGNSLRMNGNSVHILLRNSAQVSLDVFDMRGQKVRSILNGSMSAGDHVVDMNQQALPKGIYTLRLRYANQVKTVRFINR